jgi:4-carboxymuconolactone decarboxylase
MDKEIFEKGVAVRRQVLGSEYIDRALATANEFTLPMQELVTTYCWGEIWTRPGLDRKMRSMVNLAMLSALNRPHEIKAHVRGAITNGVTKAEIQEVFLQVPITAVFRPLSRVSGSPAKYSMRWVFNRRHKRSQAVM